MADLGSRLFQGPKSTGGERGVWIVASSYGEAAAIYRKVRAKEPAELVLVAAEDILTLPRLLRSTPAEAAAPRPAETPDWPTVAANVAGALEGYEIFQAKADWTSENLTAAVLDGLRPLWPEARPAETEGAGGISLIAAERCRQVEEIDRLLRVGQAAATPPALSPEPETEAVEPEPERAPFEEPGDAEPPSPEAGEAESATPGISDEELVRRAVRNARPRHPAGGVRWHAVVEALAVGSSYAVNLCRRFNLDPNEELPGRMLVEDVDEEVSVPEPPAGEPPKPKCGMRDPVSPSWVCLLPYGHLTVSRCEFSAPEVARLAGFGPPKPLCGVADPNGSAYPCSKFAGHEPADHSNGHGDWPVEPAGEPEPVADPAVMGYRYECQKCGDSGVLLSRPRYCGVCVGGDTRVSTEPLIHLADHRAVAASLFAPPPPPPAGPTSAYVDIVFDGPPSHESGRFVEVEDATGASINLGEWVKKGAYWRLRIPDPRVAPPPAGPPAGNEGTAMGIAPRDVRDAFDFYKVGNSYANTARWAKVPGETEGALWSAFEHGYEAGRAAVHAPQAPPTVAADPTPTPEG
jgi:hypothetical protein